jgi:UDP-N-acetyl-D-glucosamine/UDP-N-acetyl-D-galactosamine dehydrogenase
MVSQSITMQAPSRQHSGLTQKTVAPTICVIGLGYVGLPLAYAFGKTGWQTYGYDISAGRIEELQKNRDSTNELTGEQLKETEIEFSADPAIIAKSNVIILAIPTPIDEENNPDLTLLRKATEAVGKHLQKGSIVVYESTVYPGVTEEICGPILEEVSGLEQGKDFKLGYSPERINPGDKEHTIDKIVKVVGGEDEETTDQLVELYGRIITAGIHRAPNIKVAEMSKAIENAQRDLNIAYMNEIARMCAALGIETSEVLKAAGTKWNFLRFTPGLVGGHCIGVDPYYLVEKGRMLGIGMPMITSARKINDGMAGYVADRVMEALRQKKNEEVEERPKVLALGLTFKENIPDTRNSKAADVVRHLEQAGCEVDSHDPYVENNGALKEKNTYDAILLLVPHREYVSMDAEEFAGLGKAGALLFDLRSVIDRNNVEQTGMRYLAL